MFSPVPITKKITLLGTEHFNLYLIKGETYAVIEGGVSGVTYPFLKQLADLNVPPEAVSHLVILHSHFDHMMIFPSLIARNPGMKVASSGANRPTFSSERILSKIFDSDRKMTLALMQRGLISEAPDLSPIARFPLDLPLEENSVLDLGDGVKIRFFEAPGHSPDCMGACVEDEGVLFCSDGSGFYTPPDFFRPNYWFNLGDAERSVEKMRAIDPRILCRGHYGAVLGREVVRKHLEMARRCIDDFKVFVLERIQAGESADAVAKFVTEKFSKGFLEFFPSEENLRLWRLLVRRTLEHFGIEVEGRQEGSGENKSRCGVRGPGP
jgi:glyoxylase-like metal-dependent hydrolase (beta-lactamase superfamily II)